MRQEKCKWLMPVKDSNGTPDCENPTEDWIGEAKARERESINNPLCLDQSGVALSCEVGSAIS